MKLYVYCYYDRVAGVYAQPFFSPFNSEDMIESLRRAVVTGQADKLKDQSLYYIGIYDDKVAEFIIDSKPVFLANIEDWQNGSQEKTNA